MNYAKWIFSSTKNVEISILFTKALLRGRARGRWREPNRKLRIKMSSFLRFYLTKRIFGGIIVATEFGKPTDGADYAEPI